MRDDAVLPGNPVVVETGIMVPVSVLDDPVIQRMVDQFQAHPDQVRKLAVGLRQEPHIEIRLGHRHLPGLGRIEGFDGLGDIGDGLGIIQFFAQDDPVVGDGFIR